MEFFQGGVAMALEPQSLTELLAQEARATSRAWVPWGHPNSWIVLKGKSHLLMMNRGTPLFLGKTT